MSDTRIRPAHAGDLDAMLAILPRLAEFDLPPRRRAGDLWEADANTLRAWAERREQELIVLVADHRVQGVIGVALVRLQPEFMSKAPSAHLEALAVSVDGQGLGHRLLQAAEQAALEAGAGSMTLHVFVNNARARALYERMGYEGELIRYVKHLVD